ncbi:hypothetical protein FSOLCH5_013594 [Fusarium solani]|uniref:Uncharacterized protein n=1 Tax=Fusarium solani TaxID=169388 RepID=A0A9P9JVS2_FUSSL|nr:uncharacterized protein B0J15DRAFT_554802 [Fusarium solani]KAH7234270.1 hypothetical protein B0J15DRAFT_554802 [Fusarium solani]KAI8648394.1 hypothetical protein NCS56_01524000 [Fusarium sp. Ph1]KAJ3455900.1 hypothetical protein MRS44_017382 [Fusarium solani]KAJ4208834.1 hypothetical protein NW759_013596 [Fusarium solani]
MVSFKAFCSALAFQALAVSAAPAEEVPKFTPPNKLQAQASIFYCSNIRWNGECRAVGVPLDTCHNLPKAWNDRISSIKNQAKSAYKCTWYIGYNCNGKSYSNQEDANLADGDGAFNDSISSYSCRRK